MTQNEMNAFLFNSKAVDEARSMTPEPVNEYIRFLERQNYALWEAAYHHGFYQDVEEYMVKHGNDPIPFEW